MRDDRLAERVHLDGVRELFLQPRGINPGMKQFNPGFHSPFVQSRRERLHPIRAGQELPLGPQGFDLAVVYVRRPVDPAILACVGLPHGVVGILTTPERGGSF